MKSVITLKKIAEQGCNYFSFKKSMQHTEKLCVWIEDLKQCHIPYLFLIISNISLICDECQLKISDFSGEKFEGYEVL
jgi:ribosomal protein L33